MEHQRIASDPAVMMGKPVIRGTRIPVEIILRMLGMGYTKAQVVEQYPSISEDDVLAAQTFAADYMSSIKVMAAE